MASALTRNAYGVTLKIGPGLAQEPDGAVTASGEGLQARQVFAVGLGQTQFALLAAPVGPLMVAVNGQDQIPGYDFVVVGTTLTWTSPDFALAAGDVVVVTY